MQVVTFGCRLNTFESAVIEKLVGDDLPNVILFNTCAVTGEAERQVRQAIRKTRREHPQARIIVAGCAAQLHPEVYAAMPEVDRVLGNHEKLSREALLGEEKIMADPMTVAGPDIPIVSDFEGKAKAFLQIQQGCDYACTFCVVSQIRGANRGLAPDKVIHQAREFVKNGYPELIITGVDVTAYPDGFCKIVRRLLREVDGLKRLRFGSLDPAALDDEFVSLMGAEERLMPHLHLSVQSGDNLILKRMGRRHTREDVLSLTERIRMVRPNAVFGADFITGFPTETQEQFQQTLDLVQRAGLTHLHVFPYSEREGTPAAKMPKVPVSVRRERARRLREVGQVCFDALSDACIGKTMQVLVEQSGMGMSENYIRVHFTGEAQPAQIVPVRIIGKDKHGLVGQI